ncbi:MAG: hypothetical protein U5K69_21860 [Balneolaceae bacterium]|nr:hypothetical protein [Balneolaceae bacterium]
MSKDDEMNKGYSRKEFLKRISLGVGGAFALPGLAGASNGFGSDNHLYYYQQWEKRRTARQ